MYTIKLNNTLALAFAFSARKEIESMHHAMKSAAWLLREISKRAISKRAILLTFYYI